MIHECACDDFGQCPHAIEDLVEWLTERILQGYEKE